MARKKVCVFFFLVIPFMALTILLLGKQNYFIVSRTSCFLVTSFNESPVISVKNNTLFASIEQMKKIVLVLFKTLLYFPICVETVV